MKLPFKKGDNVTVGNSDVIYNVEKIHKHQVQIREVGKGPNGQRFVPFWVDTCILKKAR